jgi:hypothetical protein
MKGKISSLSIILLTLACLANAITVYTLDEQFSQTDQTVLRFKIENNSSDTLNGIELRYHAVQDTSLIAEPDLYYLPGGMANWSFDDSVNATLVIYIPDIVLYPGDTLGGNPGFAVGLHNKDWSTWTKEDDPSQPASNVFSIAENVEILSKGQSLMLDVGKYQGCPVVQFVEVEKDSISLLVLRQLSTDSSSIIIKNKDGVSVSANLNDAIIDSLGQKIWRGFILTQDTVEHRGELKAECGGNLLAYFAYGWKPTGASTAVAKKLWEKTDSFVKADFDMGFNQGLVDGQRLILQRDSLGRFLDARRIDNWKFYRSWENPGENAMPVIWTPLVMQYNQQDADSLSLEWSPIDKVDMYHLVVVQVSVVGDSVVFGDTVVSKAVDFSSLKIEMLPAGNYIWFVEPLVEVALDENEEGAEYYYVNGDMVSHEMPRGLWKKFKKWAKKTVKKATQVFSPVLYTAFYGGNLMDNVGYSISHFNPIGIIQVFLPTTTLYTKTNSITKNMSELSKSYKAGYIYNAYPTDACFGTGAFCAMKDTRMLAEDWSEGFNKDNWNKLFPKIDFWNGKVNYAVHNRCWLTMAQMINHYKGGNVSSDEILYYVRSGFSDTSFGGPVETMQAVNYALGMTAWDNITYTALLDAYRGSGAIPSVDGWTVGTPTLHTIMNVIEAGNVLGVSQLNAGNKGGHSMVLNGYKIDSNGDVYIHLLNTDNMGTAEWRYYCTITSLGSDVIVSTVLNGIGHLIDLIPGVQISGNTFFTFYEPPLYASGRSANASVFADNDNDGIVDFDEIERFGTEPLNDDSDGDKKNDYEEIYDFMQCMGGSEYTSKSDIDGDGLLAARDPDSDGDGYCDEQEIAYEDGNPHSCERFNGSIHPDDSLPKCANYDYSLALLAKERLALNDRASCITINGSYCPIASYEMEYGGAYGVSLGVNASVGNIYSAKSVLLRDRAKVYGNLETAGSVEKQSSTSVVTGTIVEHSDRAGAYELMYAPVLDNATLNGDVTIHHQYSFNTGETLYSHILGAGANNIEFLFNSGSNLVFNTNVCLAGSLRFQNGAKMYAPTESVVFHIGNDFQWNGTIETNDMISAAQRIMVYYYGTNRVFIQSDFAGTIVAPNAEVVVGQSGKNFYGAIYAKSIVIHQNTRITWVPFVSQQNNSVVAYATDLNYSINFLEI